MDALTLSGLQAGINTAGSVTSSLIGNIFNRNEWKRQAEYNSPVNQMARLKQAGLNPTTDHVRKHTANVNWSLNSMIAAIIMQRTTTSAVTPCTRASI